MLKENRENKINKRKSYGDKLDHQSQHVLLQIKDDMAILPTTQ
jgi:hypothetical protein